MVCLLESKKARPIMHDRLPRDSRRVLSIGSAVVDIFIKSSNFQIEQAGDETLLNQTFGSKIEIDHLEMKSGGAATNTSVAFHRLGFASSVVAEMGKDNLVRIIEDDLQQEGVDMELLIRERKEQTGGSVILLGGDGQRIIMVHRAAAGMLGTDDIPWSQLRDFEWIHVTSLGTQLQLMAALQQYFVSEDIPWSWNPGKNELNALVAGTLSFEAGGPDILFINQEEWEILGAKQEQARKMVPILVVTRGKAGGVVYEHGMPAQSFTAAAVESVDDTGAGDAFAAAFVAARLREETVMTAARWGVLNAASVVQQIGAKPGLLRYDQLLKQQQWYDEGLE